MNSSYNKNKNYSNYSPKESYHPPIQSQTERNINDNQIEKKGNEDKEGKIYLLKKYRLSVFIIIIILLFIISIIIISLFGKIKSKSKSMSILLPSRQLFSNNYSAISAIFSLEIILIVAFFGIFLYNYIKEIKEYYEILLLIIVIVCNFLYLINCIIIPIYLKEFKYIINSNINESQSILEELNNILSYYTGAITSCYIFLVLLLFLDFILLNLYNNLLCNSEIFITFLLDFFCHSFDEKGEIEKEYIKKINKKKQITKEIKKLLIEDFNKKIIAKKDEIKKKFKLNNKQKYI